MTRPVCSFLIGTSALVLAAGSTSAEDRSDFNPRKLMRPVRAIVDAPFLAASEVTDEVDDNELVIGVVVGDQARAYPVNMLTGRSREIINDTVARSPIAATW
jgi:hypothetical protein